MILLPGTTNARPPGESVERAWIQASPEVLEQLAHEFGLGIDHGAGPTGSWVYGTPSSLDAIRSAGWTATLDTPSPPPLDGYRLPDEGGDVLGSLADSSDRVGLAVLGFSVEGHPIEGVWIGQPPESGAPVHRILGAHHGDEWSSFEIALSTAQALVAGDGSDPAITVLLDQVTIWVVPYTNPDGVFAISRWNANSVDLNRNYDYEWTPAEFRAGPAPFSEPETRAIRAFSSWVQPVLGLSLHSGAANFGWVWNYTRQPAEDAATLEDQAVRYASMTSMPGFWITNGAEWYVTHGDTNDYSYGRYGVWDSTLELTEAKLPDGSEIGGFTDAHLPAMLDYVAILPDVSGQVIDAATGRPVDASVQLLDGGAPRGRPFRTEASTGWFHRIAPASGATHVAVSAIGYASETAPLDQPGPIELAPGPLDGRALLPAPLEGALPQLPDPLDGTVTLHQPGHPSLEVQADFGILQVATPLAGGAWTVERPDGTVHRHALLVNDAVRTTAEAAELDAGGLTIPGSGFEPGVRVWALFGDDRARVPVPVLERRSDALFLDRSALPSDGRTDLWILNAGEHLFVTDIHDSEPETWGLEAGRPKLVGRACGCNVKTGHLPQDLASALVLLLILLRRRTP